MWISTSEITWKLRNQFFWWQFPYMTKPKQPLRWLNSSYSISRSQIGEGEVRKEFLTWSTLQYNKLIIEATYISTSSDASVLHTHTDGMANPHHHPADSFRTDDNMFCHLFFILFQKCKRTRYLKMAVVICSTQSRFLYIRNEFHNCRHPLILWHWQWESSHISARQKEKKIQLTHNTIRIYRYR